MKTNDVTQLIADAWIAEHNAILDLPWGEERDAQLRQLNTCITPELFDHIGILEAVMQRLDRTIHRYTFEDLEAQRKRAGDDPHQMN